MHQNKPNAPITYINDNGVQVSVPDDNLDWSKDTKPLNLTLPELAILQTLTNRSYLNCNCNLNKNVLAGIVTKIKNNLCLYD